MNLAMLSLIVLLSHIHCVDSMQVSWIQVSITIADKRRVQRNIFSYFCMETYIAGTH